MGEVLFLVLDPQLQVGGVEAFGEIQEVGVASRSPTASLALIPALYQRIPGEANSHDRA